MTHAWLSISVSVNCADGSSDATVTVKSDMAVKIVTECATGSTDYTGEISGQTVGQDITVKYGTATAGSCYFMVGVSYVKQYSIFFLSFLANSKCNSSLP